jgi:hypothetical protein
MDSGSLLGRAALAFLLPLALTVALPAEAEILSFQAWKSARVDEARTNIDKIQSDKSGSAAAAASPKGAASTGLIRPARTDQRLAQAQSGLEVAQELSVNDYFVLYLSQMRGREAFVEAAKKLTPEESAELMMSYQKHLSLNGSGYDETLPSGAAASPTPNFRKAN